MDGENKGIALVLHCLENPWNTPVVGCWEKRRPRQPLKSRAGSENSRRSLWPKAIEELRAMQEKVITYIQDNNGQAPQRNIQRSCCRPMNAKQTESFLQHIKQIEKVQEGNKVWRIKGSQS